MSGAIVSRLVRYWLEIVPGTRTGPFRCEPRTVAGRWPSFVESSVAPIERSCSPLPCQASATSWRVSAATTGSTRIVCATIIAVGVNRMPSEPSGPARDSSRYTTSPTTTEGSASSVLSVAIAALRPGTRATASHAPSTMPKAAATRQAAALT